MGGGDSVSSARNRGWRAGPASTIRIDGTRLPARTYAEFQTAARSEFFTGGGCDRGKQRVSLSLFRFTVHWTSRITGELAKILGRVSLERKRESEKKKKERKKGERKEGKGIKGAEMEAEKARR